MRDRECPIGDCTATVEFDEPVTEVTPRYRLHDLDGVDEFADCPNCEAAVAGFYEETDGDGEGDVELILDIDGGDGGGGDGDGSDDAAANDADGLSFDDPPEEATEDAVETEEFDTDEFDTDAFDESEFSDDDPDFLDEDDEVFGS